MKLLLAIVMLFLIGIMVIPFFAPPITLAANENPTFGDFEAPLPGIDKNIDKFIREANPIVRYANVVINIVTVLIVMIGTISVVVGGYLYMTARGDAQQVSTAKVWIGSALLGITLALTAWLILNTISPQFTTGLADPVILRQ